MSNNLHNRESEKIFFKGQDYFAALLFDIEDAEKSIELESYIFSLDKIGKKVIDTLTRATKRGVKVRVLVDGAGTPQWGGSLVRNLEKSGAETRVFHPFPWRIWQWSRSRVHIGFLLKLIYLCLKINSRNHRKICIIDKKIVYIGSFNVSQNHLDTGDAEKGWRDTGVRLKNLDLKEITLAFESAWAHIPIQERVHNFFQHVRGNPVIRLNNAWYRRRILYKNLLNRVRECKKRVWITNAYFVPDSFLLKRLIDASSRGVDVRILLPQHSDVVFMPWASKAFYKRLLKAGIRIFEYLPSVLHAKTLILDDWMMVGSSNLNHRSLLHDLEVDVDIRLSESKDELEKQFLIDLKNSKEVRLEDWQKRAWYQGLIGRALLYLKFII